MTITNAMLDAWEKWNATRQAQNVSSSPREHGLPDKHLHPTHYDLLRDCGARMDDFVRADVLAVNVLAAARGARDGMDSITLGFITIFVGVGIIVVGIVRKPSSLETPLPLNIKAVLTPTHSFKPFASHTKETTIAVLWAIPFKSWGPDDAEYDRVTQADLEKEKQDVIHLREWASSLEDGDVKDAYLMWANHFDRQIVATEDELRTHARRNARQDETNRRNAALATIPEPPQ
jgi:hypothetical protein